METCLNTVWTAQAGWKWAPQMPQVIAPIKRTLGATRMRRTQLHWQACPLLLLFRPPRGRYCCTSLLYGTSEGAVSGEETAPDLRRDGGI